MSESNKSLNGFTKRREKWYNPFRYNWIVSRLCVGDREQLGDGGKLKGGAGDCLSVSSNAKCNLSLCYVALWLCFWKRCILCVHFNKHVNKLFARFDSACLVYVCLYMSVFIFGINYCVQKPRGNVISKLHLPGFRVCVSLKL